MNHPVPVIAYASHSVSLLAVLCALLYTVTALRLLCYYRPKGARHRPAVSLTACGLIAALSCRALALLAFDAHAYPAEVIASAALCFVALAVRGNLAAILRRFQCPKS